MQKPVDYNGVRVVRLIFLCSVLYVLKAESLLQLSFFFNPLKLSPICEFEYNNPFGTVVISSIDTCSYHVHVILNRHCIIFHIYQLKALIMTLQTNIIER